MAADGEAEPDTHLITVSPAGHAAGQSLVHRAWQTVERWTWRTPLHDRRLDGRHPVRLLATLRDPIPGDPEVGAALLDGWMIAGGEVRALDALDMAAPGGAPDFTAHVHGFAWLRDLAAAGEPAAAEPLAQALAARWLAAHADRVSDPAWRPDVAGRRLATWIAHAPLLLSSGDLIFRSRLLNNIARAARHLDRTADKVPVGAPRVAAWSGVVVAGLLIPGGETRQQVGEAGLARALAASLFDDGGTIGRSPAALLDMIASVASLRAAYGARGLALPDPLAQPLARMIPALLGTAMGDGGLAGWQGAVPVDPARVDDVLDASGVMGRPLRQSGDWGYQRMAAGEAVLVMDAAPPPAITRGGCASTLAFELSDRAERLIVNCGGGARAGARFSAEVALGLRSTAAHSTLVVANSNSTALHADGSLGRGVTQVRLSRQESDNGSRIEARHDGYARQYGFTHCRRLTLAADGRELRGEDAILPATAHPPAWGRRNPVANVPFALRFHLGPGVEAAATADGHAAMLRTPGGAFWHFRSRSERLVLEDSVWADPDGQLVPTRQIVVHGLSPVGGATAAWVFKRAL